VSEPEPKKKNRRLFPRRSAIPKVKVTCRTNVLDMGPNVAVAVLDVSETGVRLLVNVPLQVGQEVLLGMEGAAHPRPVMRQGKVVWCVQVTEGGHCAGIRLEKDLKGEDVEKVT
jgi:hypothetical protein